MRHALLSRAVTRSLATSRRRFTWPRSPPSASSCAMDVDSAPPPCAIPTFLAQGGVDGVDGFLKVSGSGLFCTFVRQGSPRCVVGRSSHVRFFLSVPGDGLRGLSGRSGASCLFSRSCDAAGVACCSSTDCGRLFDPSMYSDACGLCRVVCVYLIRSMEPAAGGPKAKVPPQFLRFFETLGVAEPLKVQTLARLLRSFHHVAAQLDAQLALVGASLHSALSRMVNTESPLAPPQYRWIRVVDRLGFFNDSDLYAGRLVSNGMSYAYRHNELDVLAAANALRLIDRRQSVAPEDPRASGDQPPLLVPPGGIVIPRPPTSGDQGPPAESSLSRPPILPPGSGSWPHPDGGGLLVPPGGIVVGRPGAGVENNDASPPGSSPAGELHKDAGSTPVLADGQLQPGGVVVAVRDRSNSPAVLATVAGVEVSVSNAAQPRGVVQVDSVPAPPILSSVPVVNPSDVAVECVTTVIDGLRDREDVRDVLHRLVCDSLILLSRLHGRSGAGVAVEEDAVNSQLTWSVVRKVVYRWWPVWEAADGEGGKQGPTPPPGTVSYLSHPNRPGKFSRWAIDVDI